MEKVMRHDDISSYLDGKRKNPKKDGHRNRKKYNQNEGSLLCSSRTGSITGDGKGS